MMVQVGQIWAAKINKTTKVEVTMVWPNVMVRYIGNGYSFYSSRYLLETDFILDEASVVDQILVKYGQI